MKGARRKADAADPRLLALFKAAEKAGLLDALLLARFTFGTQAV